MSDPAPAITGHLDLCTLQTVNGWAYDPAQPDEAVELEVLSDGQILLTFTADQFRPDLHGAGYGNGRHAFTMDLPAAAFTRPAVELRVRVRTTGEDLRGSPVRLSNRAVALTADTLGDLAVSVAATLDKAAAARELQPLAVWLLRQLDAVWARQGALDASERGRAQRFTELVGANTALSDVLRGACAAVVARYPVLHLPEAAAPELSVIVPSHNQWADTYRCVQALLRHRPAAAMEVIVVDDGSADETVYAGFVLSGAVRLLRHGAALGAAASVNAAAAVARGRHLFLTGPAAEVQPGALDELLATAADARVGAAASALLDADGALREAGAIVWRGGERDAWGAGDDPQRPDYAFLREADAVSGLATLIPREVFAALGGLAAPLGGYADAGLCMAVRAAGLRVTVQPLSRVVVHGPASVDATGQPAFLHRWMEALRRHPVRGADPRLAAERLLGPRALVIDGAGADGPGRADVTALQRLGYHVSYVQPGDMARRPGETEALERAGVRCFCAPAYQSVEEVLRRAPTAFELFYVIGAEAMTSYAAMIRHRSPTGRLVLADATGDAAALAAADSAVLAYPAARAAWEAAGIRTSLHVAPRPPAGLPDPAPFNERAGIAVLLIGRPPDDLAAAAWMVEEVLPLVHVMSPGIECTVLDRRMPPALAALARPGVTLLAQADTADVLRRTRMTVAPLQPGAASQAAVLTSLAHGVPCLMTPAAAAGLDLPPDYAAAVVAKPAEFADLIVRLHEDPELHATLRESGLRYLAALPPPDAALAAACLAAGPPAA